MQTTKPSIETQVRYLMTRGSRGGIEAFVTREKANLTVEQTDALRAAWARAPGSSQVSRREFNHEEA